MHWNTPTTAICCIPKVRLGRKYHGTGTHHMATQYPRRIDAKILHSDGTFICIIFCRETYAK
jgi:hypothetical protein